MTKGIPSSQYVTQHVVRPYGLAYDENLVASTAALDRYLTVDDRIEGRAVDRFNDLLPRPPMSPEAPQHVPDS